MIDDIERKRIVLEHCKGLAKSLSPLKSKIPHSSLDNIRKDLLKMGLIKKIGGKYLTTEAGENALKEEQLKLKTLESIYPQLKLIPIPMYSALMHLLLSAIVVRRDEIKNDLHPTFIIYGDTQKWKTWFTKFACGLLGLNPVKLIIFVPSETPKSLMTRRDARGKTITTRDILKKPIACFDELSDGEINVQKTVKLFIQGQKKVSYENETIDMEAVPIITLNPKKGETPEEKCDLKTALIRRSIPCDMDEVKIPDEIITTGEEILEKLSETENIKLPKHKSKCLEYRDSVSRFLKAVLTEEAFKMVNTETLLMLCAGMTAFLPTKDAIIQTLYDYLFIVEKLGWAQPEWRDELTNFTHSITSNNFLPLESENKYITVIPTNLREEMIAKLSLEKNPLDYTHNLDIMDKALEELNLSPLWIEKIKQQMESMYKCNTTFWDINIMLKDIEETSLENVQNVVRKYRRLDYANKFLEERNDELAASIEEDEKRVNENLKLIEELGSTPEEIKQLNSMKGIIEDSGVEVEKLFEFLRRNIQLEEMGLDEKEVDKLAMEEKRLGKGSIKKMVKKMDENVSLDDMLIIKKQDLEICSRYKEDLQKICNGLAENYAETKDKSDNVRNELKKSRIELNDVTEKIAKAKEKLSGFENEIEINEAYKQLIVGILSESDLLWNDLINKRKEYFYNKSKGIIPTNHEIPQYSKEILIKAVLKSLGDDQILKSIYNSDVNYYKTGWEKEIEYYAKTEERLLDRITELEEDNGRLRDKIHEKRIDNIGEVFRSGFKIFQHEIENERKKYKQKYEENKKNNPFLK